MTSVENYGTELVNPAFTAGTEQHILRADGVIKPYEVDLFATVMQLPT